MFIDMNQHLLNYMHTLVSKGDLIKSVWEESSFDGINDIPPSLKNFREYTVTYKAENPKKNHRV